MKKFVVILLACFLLCGAASGSIIDHRFDLKLLLHGNLEPPTLSTSDFRDSSRAFQMPASALNTSGAVDTNISQTKYGNASIFIKGLTTNLTISDNDGYTFGTNNYSICSWLYWPTTVQRTEIFTHYVDANNYDQFRVYDTGNLDFYRLRGGVSMGSGGVAVGSVIVPAKWYQACAIQNGTTMQMYLNGTAVGAPITRTGSQTDLSAPVRIGGSYTGTSPVQYIDEVTVFNGGFAPTISELQGEYPMYLNGTFGGYADDNYTVSLLHMDGSEGGTLIKDQYGNRTWTTSGNIQTKAVWKKYGSTGAGYIDTNYNWISPTVTDNSTFNFGTSDWTVDTWLVPNTSASQWLIYGDGGTSSKGYTLACVQSTGTCSVSSNATGVWATNVQATSSKAVLVPTHIAFVRYGTLLSIYRDGFLEAQSTIPAGANFVTYENGIFTRVLFGVGIGSGYDEPRITKGLARWTANFTPPVTPYELITNQTWTPTPDASGTIPATIQFTDGTPSTAWTANGYSWTFGDTGTSTSQSPSHVYSTTGLFSATGNVFNNNMTTALTKTVPIGAPDISYACSPLTGTAALTVTCTDQSTNYTPITSYLIDFGDGTTSTDSPPWVHVYSTYGAFSINLTEVNSIGTGFLFKRDYIVVSTEQNPPQVQSYPQYVTFHLMEGWGDSISVVNVTLVPVSTSTGNYDWLASLVGIPLDEVPLANQTLTQFTDDTGISTFYVIPTTKYNVTFQKTGYTFNPAVMTLTMHDYYIFPTNVPNPYYEHGYDQVSAINLTVSQNEVNDTAFWLNMSYDDATGSTTGGSIVVVQRNTIPYQANTTIATWPVTGSSCSNNTLIIHTQEVNGNVIGNITTGQFGIVQRTFPYTMRGAPVTFLGFGQEIALLVALGMMLGTAMLAGATHSRPIVFTMSFEGWIFYAIGWFDSLILRGVPEIALQLALSLITLLSLFAIFEMRKKKEKY
jgi:PKD repeat protein